MQKYRDRGTGGGGDHGRPTFSMDNESSLPAWNSSRAIPPPPPPPPLLQNRLRGRCNTNTEYSKNKCYTIKMNLYTKDVIYIFKHQSV
jgi:hypothetical protein